MHTVAKFQSLLDHSAPAQIANCLLLIITLPAAAKNITAPAALFVCAPAKLLVWEGPLTT
jgi:hypothetical protein